MSSSRFHVAVVFFAASSSSLLACGSGGGGSGGGAAPPSAPSSVLHRAVHIDLPSDGGALVSLPLAGRATVVDAWAPSCVPCRTKLPALVKRSAELEAAGAKLVLVAVLADGESTDAARATLASWGVTSPFLVDRGDVLRREAGVTDLPTTLVLTPGGEVRWVSPVGATPDDVVSAVRAAR